MRITSEQIADYEASLARSEAEYAVFESSLEFRIGAAEVWAAKMRSGEWTPGCREERQARLILNG